MLENLLKYDIKLASGSPRRRELLSMLCVGYEVVGGRDVDESWPDSLAPDEVPAYLAQLKADAYRDIVTGNTMMITADTVVICDAAIIGKPTDEEDACRMLRTLSGRTHRVVTGVCVTTADRRETFSATTFVTFAPLTEEEITEYVTRFKPLDKAGAYGIQECIGAIAVEKIDGSFYNVMGLPVHQLYTLLKTF